MEEQRLLFWLRRWQPNGYRLKRGLFQLFSIPQFKIRQRFGFQGSELHRYGKNGFQIFDHGFRQNPS